MSQGTWTSSTAHSRQGLGLSLLLRKMEPGVGPTSGDCETWTGDTQEGSLRLQRVSRPCPVTAPTPHSARAPPLKEARQRKWKVPLPFLLH